MFAKFFVTFHDDNVSGQTAYARGTGTIANPASTYKLPTQMNTSFNQIVQSLSTKFGYHEEYIYNTRECTRTVLISIPDEITFQLELIGVTENCFCTYNLESKQIGFGNTKRNASTASMSSMKSGMAYAGGTSSGGIWLAPNKPVEQSFFDFTIPKFETESFEFQVPEVFLPRLTDEVMPYVKFEKALMFNDAVTELHINIGVIKSYLSTFYEPENSLKFKERLTVPRQHIKKCFEFYRFDDEDVFATKEENPNNFEIMRELCLKIMQLTNETF